METMTQRIHHRLPSSNDKELWMVSAEHTMDVYEYSEHSLLLVDVDTCIPSVQAYDAAMRSCGWYQQSIPWDVYEYSEHSLLLIGTDTWIPWMDGVQG